MARGGLTFCAVALVCLASSKSGSAETKFNVSINTAAVSGTGGQLVFDFTTNNPHRPGNHVQVLNFAAGGTQGLPQTQGGLVTGALILGLNPAPFTIIDTDFFFNELTVSFVSFGNSISFQLQLPELPPPGGAIPDQFALFLLDSTGKALFPTSDPLGPNALFAVDITGSLGGALSVFSPAVFTPPNNLQITVPSSDTTPPVTTATASPGPNANGWNNTNVRVDLNSTDNEPGGTGVKEIHLSLTGAQTGTSVVAGSTTTVTISAEGTTTLTYFAIDNAGNQEMPKALTVRVDKTPPVVSGLPAPDCALWPPNHKLVEAATVTVADALSGPASFDVTGTSNEPPGPGETDIVIEGSGVQPRSVQLRSERLGTGTGRIYTLTATASDLAGNATTATATCIVPHDQGHR